MARRRAAQGLNTGGWPGDRSDARCSARARRPRAARVRLEVACNGAFGAGSRLLRHGLAVRPRPLRASRASTARPGGSSTTSRAAGARGRARRRARPALAGQLLARAQPLLQRLARATARPGPRRGESCAGSWRRNAPVAHELAAIGHAHIDTAWLWPIAETYRKCVRTFASQLALHGRLPRATGSPARRRSSTRGSGARPEPVRRGSASAVERGQFDAGRRDAGSSPTATSPPASRSCASSCYGQRFFEREFGRRCREFWNPDVFGYNGQLPQIMRGAGIERFLTQKLSWNRFNKPPHHTFRWQGIDGSEVLDALPAGRHLQRRGDRARRCAGVGARLQGPRPLAHELPALRLRRRRRRADRADARDAGARRATCRACRARRMRTSDEFFDGSRPSATTWPVLVGELYFEYHRGTYTTQAATSAATAAASSCCTTSSCWPRCAARSGDYPRASSTRLWKIAAAEPVPRHPPRLVDQRGLRGRRARLRRDRGGASAAGAALGALATGRRPPAAQHARRRARARSVESPAARLARRGAAVRRSGRAVEAGAPVAPRADGGCVLENAHLRAVVGADGRLAELVARRAAARRSPRPANVSSSTRTGRSTGTPGTSIRSTSRRGGTARPRTASRVVREHAAARRDRLRAAHRGASAGTQTIRLDAGCAAPRVRHWRSTGTRSRRS